jgi:hypothetical protein
LAIICDVFLGAVRGVSWWNGVFPFRFDSVVPSYNYNVPGGTTNLTGGVVTMAGINVYANAGWMYLASSDFLVNGTLRVRPLSSFFSWDEFLLFSFSLACGTVVMMMGRRVLFQDVRPPRLPGALCNAVEAYMSGSVLSLRTSPSLPTLHCLCAVHSWVWTLTSSAHSPAPTLWSGRPTSSSAPPTTPTAARCPCWRPSPSSPAPRRGAT